MQQFPNSQKLNPWFSMWTRPRATIQQIIDTNPKHLVLVLAAISGFSNTLGRASFKSLGDHLSVPSIFLVAAFFGPIAGIIGLYLWGFLLRWTGKKLGGTGSAINIRAAIAWATVPLIWALFLWIPELAIFGKELFTSATPHLDTSPMLILLLIGFGLIEMIIAIWSMVVFVKSLAQVQGFTAWRALGNAILAFLVLLGIILIPILIIVAVIFLLF